MICTITWLFIKKFVDSDGFRVRSILSLPIKDHEGQTIGVVQLMNKTNEKPFIEADVNIVEVITYINAIYM